MMHAMHDDGNRGGERGTGNGERGTGNGEERQKQQPKSKRRNKQKQN